MRTTRFQPGRVGSAAAAAAVVLAGFIAWLAVTRFEIPGTGIDISGAIHISEPGYRLVADPDTGEVSLTSPSGAAYTSFPLVALAGRPALPAGAKARLFRQGAGLVGEVLTSNGAVIQRAVLTPKAASFTVRFEVLPGADLDAKPTFFSDGKRGLDLRTVTASYSPGNPEAESLYPGVVSAGRIPLAPPPLDVQLRTSAGWFGIGLVQVPDATAMLVQSDGSLLMDYPLRLLTTFRNSGGGGLAGSDLPGKALRFPDFVFTFAADPMNGLSAYNRALVGMNLAPGSRPARPAWWQQPIVDTWGAQEVDGVTRGSPGFDTAWVQRFAASSQQRLGLPSFTLVIDSRWQTVYGRPEPDPRFGGWAGMRTLIDQLHARGLRVLLWWPMWADGPEALFSPLQVAYRNRPFVDPTRTTFPAAMAATMQQLLGAGPGELDADGLKLDWTYDINPAPENPALGWGDTALYRYLSVLHSAAHTVRSDAYIEASAAAPQFAAVADGVRLYDAWSLAAWTRRAQIVSEASPTALIDGDGWDVPPASALLHAVSSTVYGIPAMYFDDRWRRGEPISPDMARRLGAVMGLAAVKGSGQARLQAGGEWSWLSGGRIRAQTFGGGRDLVSWNADSRSGIAVAGDPAAAVLPLPQGQRALITGPSGEAVRTTPAPGGVRVVLVPGVAYTVAVRSA
ncbi:MAG: hypothetical protein J2P45_10990 [Candidatus Dormibacteraeota bacterium]|nr:hypothetical protein [Candidatus Dormibacteraeota bacterium]